MKIHSWLKAARLRTLPLSLSGIVLGSFIAYQQGFWSNWIFLLSLLTTLFLQVLSNFANDLGDSYKGADNAERLGPVRAIQSGEISQKEMLGGVILMSILSLVVAVPLILIGVKGMQSSVLWIYVILAILCIIAAITYTLGKKAYGYYGLGDVMVFAFFGLVSVLGVYSLYAKQFDWSLIGYACTIGLLSVAVLNLNNMRDHENDKKVGKNTLVVKIGFKKAKIYHALLIIIAFLGFLWSTSINEWWLHLLALLPFVVLIIHLVKVLNTKEPKELDHEMKKVALSTFAIAVLFVILTLI
ncbi:MAG: 1,4-dihydroxy-2-naphthoate octaprenyltransferase [Brumimicrobium sp.]|nr:1,4-dihydroxy-2-naphthoate octaprenyltransferase [Brumimicrobium sp.]